MVGGRCSGHSSCLLIGKQILERKGIFVMVGRVIVNHLPTLMTVLFVFSLAVSESSGQSNRYSVNGTPVAPEMGALLQHYGFEPGAYYIDPNGNYGRSGSAPMGNLSGGPMRGWSGKEPTTIDGNPYALAYVNGVAGVRVFYVYSPSVMSDIKGGASGYYHICPDNVYYQSHEGAVSMGGGPDKTKTEDRSWGGMAQQSNNKGRWEIGSSPQGPTLVLYGQQGGGQEVPITVLLQGRFEYNQTEYVVEAGKAAC